MGMAELTREELEAMDREELKALLDERGVEYSPHAHTPTLVDLALGESPEAEAQAADEEVEGLVQVEAPEFYTPQVFSPWELPANTVAAQQFISQGVVVDESLVPEDDVLAAANNEIGLYGHPEDPRLTGGSIVNEPLTTEQLAAPPPREIEMPETVEEHRTWGEKLEAEATEGEAETEEANA